MFLFEKPTNFISFEVFAGKISEHWYKIDNILQVHKVLILAHVMAMQLGATGPRHQKVIFAIKIKCHYISGEKYKRYK